MRALYGALIAAALSVFGGDARADDRGGDTDAIDCADLVVIGRVTNTGYQPIESEDDLLGHGLISMQVTIQEVLQGREPRRVVAVSYVAHTYLREDRELLLVLKPAGDGAYAVRRLYFGKSRPRLAGRCD